MGKRKELNMENWIGVCEYDREEKDSIEWLIKLLEEEKIPYKEELKKIGLDIECQHIIIV